MVSLRHNGEEEQIHEFPTRSPSNLNRRSPQWSLSTHHHRNMPPAVYIVVAVLGAVATGYALKEVRSCLLVSALARVGPLMDHITVRLRSAHRSSNSRMARTEESAPCFPAADAFPRFRSARVRVSSPHTNPGSPTDRARHCRCQRGR